MGSTGAEEDGGHTPSPDRVCVGVGCFLTCASRVRMTFVFKSSSPKSNLTLKKCKKKKKKKKESWERASWLSNCVCVCVCKGGCVFLSACDQL